MPAPLVRRFLGDIRSNLMCCLVAGGFAIGVPAAHAASGNVSISFDSFTGPVALIHPSGNIPGLINGDRATDIYDTTPSVNGGEYHLGFKDLTAYASSVGSSAVGTFASINFRYGGIPATEAPTNVISFKPRAFSGVAQGQDFVLGTLTFQNGSWFGFNSASVSRIGFTMQTTSLDGPAFNQTISGTIVLDVRTNPSIDVTTPFGQDQEADVIGIESSALLVPPPRMFVYEPCCKPAGVTATGSVDLIGRFNSLDLVGFANPTEGAFLDLTTGVTPVPEPETYAMLLAGLGLVSAVRWRRRMSRA